MMYCRRNPLHVVRVIASTRSRKVLILERQLVEERGHHTVAIRSVSDRQGKRPISTPCIGQLPLGHPLPRQLRNLPP